MKKVRITLQNNVTMADAFENYLLSCKARGLSDKTIDTYSQHLKAIKKQARIDIPIDEIDKEYIEQIVASLRDAQLASNSIKSYLRTLSAFFSWCEKEEIAVVRVPSYKAEETIKETYTDAELEVLLKKPDLKHCSFGEYRNWVIINLLINNGCRAATIRNIKIEDVDLGNKVIYLRHTKNKKAQVIPLCDILCVILKEYMRFRGGKQTDYLFSTQYGEQLTENGLRSGIERFNRKRGVEKTSIHLFRHTFAKKYLVDCGGNAFTLQRLLGHSTLDTTKLYCNLFDADISRNYDNYSPLAKIKANSERIRIR